MARISGLGGGLEGLVGMICDHGRWQYVLRHGARALINRNLCRHNAC